MSWVQGKQLVSQQRRSHERGVHKTRWTLWKQGMDNGEHRDDREEQQCITNYSQEFKREPHHHHQQMILDDACVEIPSSTSHALLMADWAALRIQTAFRGFLVSSLSLSLCTSIETIYWSTLGSDPL